MKKTYLSSLTCFLIYPLIKFISFSQGFNSGEYGGINNKLTFSFLNKLFNFYCFVNFAIISVKTILFFIFGCFLFIILKNCFRNLIILAWVKVVFVPLIPSTSLALWLTTKLILKFRGFRKSRPGIPALVQP